MESRARSVDITTQNYYDLLYAFYLSRNNFGKGLYSSYFRIYVIHVVAKFPLEYEEWILTSSLLYAIYP